MEYGSGSQAAAARDYPGPSQAPLQPRLDTASCTLKSSIDILQTIENRLFGPQAMAGSTSNAKLEAVSNSVDAYASTINADASRLHQIAVSIVERI